MKKEFLNLPFEVKQINDEDPKFFTFEGYASTFGNIDLGEDIVEKGAFIDSLSKNPDVPVLWQHNMEEPVGKSIELYEDERGLFIKAKLPKADTLVNGRIIPQMEVGSIKEMSIGFFIEDFEIKGEIRILKKINLFEVSLVTKAMNPRALVTGFKSFKETEIKSLKDIETFLKEGGLSNNESKTLISKIKEFSKQRDAEEEEVKQRDAAQKKRLEANQKLIDSMNKLTNNLNKINNDIRSN
jgi:HK97 family phage prohead protease